jgi:hypothetical protein
MKLTDDQLHILLHSVGRSDAGELPPGAYNGWRNYFCTGKGSTAFPNIEQLIAAGYMRLSHHINQDKDGIYAVTPDGQAAWQQALAARNQGKKRLTRSQKRYRAWLRTDCGESFGTWLKRQKHRNAA